eukprot:3295658-Pyramimonas_sp.AAC.1
MTAPMLIPDVDPARRKNDDDALTSAMQVFEGLRHARAADAREWPAWYEFTRIVPPTTARARAFELVRHAAQNARLAESDEQ